MTLDISIVIPTYNRKTVLEKCLKALASQIVSANYEILVIDDGSTDGTSELILNLQKGYPLELRYYAQSNLGPAAARNQGIRNAHGEIVLFMGDDIIAGKATFLQEHLNWHRKSYREREIAVLGYTTWSPELEITPLMRWLEKGGQQFSYNEMEHEAFVDTRHFYTSNISLKKSFLGDNLFDEKFPYAAYEDTELGYRLGQHGLRIAFNKEALAYHYHQVTLESYCKRSFLVGKSAAILARIHPDAFNRKINPLWRRAVKSFFFECIKPFSMSIVRYCEHKFSFPFLFTRLYSHYFWKGYIDEAKEKSFI